MPYSNSWDETQPLGSTPSNTIDEIFRQLKLDIRERMNTILSPSGQWEDDPIVLLAGGGTTIPVAYSTYMTGPHNIRAELSGGTITDWQDGYVNVEGDAKIPIILSVEDTIQALNIYINPGGLSVDCELRSCPYGSSITVVIGTPQTMTGIGFQVVPLFSGTQAAGLNTYFVKINGPGTGQWQYLGMKIITYRSLP